MDGLFRNRKEGFTLIELLVVIAIIGMLSSVVLASLNSVRAKARDTRRIADLDQIRKALELYYLDNGAYPQAGSCPYDSNCYACSSQGTYTTTLANALAPYIPTLPVDPVNTGGSPWNAGGYTYCYGNVGRYTYDDQYDLTAQFETDHPQRCLYKGYHFYFTNQPWCGGYSSYIYEASPM